MLAHQRAVALPDLRDAYPLFWQILGKTAKEWNKEELGNLLAYSMRRKPLETSDDTSTTRVINYYKSYFNTLPEEDKPRVFRDLLLRVYSEPPFRRFVHQGKADSE